MTESTRDNLEPDVTFVPPRYWWLKRLGAAGLLSVVALVGLRLWWGHVADTRLQAQIAQYRAAGEPVLLPDLAGVPLADEQNGAYFLQRAAAGISTRIDPTEVIRGLRAGTLGADDARAFLQAHGERLRLAHEARSRAAADWKTALSSPATRIMLPNLSSQRELAQVICVAACYQHALGDEAAAIETLRDALDMAGHVSVPESFLMGCLEGIRIEGRAIRALEEMTPTLRAVERGAEAGAGGQPATRAQLLALIRALLDAAPQTARWTHGMQGERVMALDTTRWILAAPTGVGSVFTGAPAPAPLAAALRGISSALTPAWILDVVRELQRCDDYTRAAEPGNWWAAQLGVLPDPGAGAAPEGAAAVAHFIRRALSPTFETALQQWYSHFALRRLTAVALALRLYELDYGERPPALAELVPAYLPAVPSDPFDPNGGPLRYRPDSSSPLLYSVGENGVDEGGAFTLRSDGSVDYHARDMPFFLNGDRPLAVPYPPARLRAAPATQPDSAQARDDDRNEEGREGDDGPSKRQRE